MPLTEYRPEDFDPQWFISMVHEQGAALGYERVRTDRGQHPDSGRWYEVGYGPLKTVTVRTSVGGSLIATEEQWEDMLPVVRVGALLRKNLEVVV